MAVELTPKLEERIRKQVESGEYASVDELLDQALDVLEDRRSEILDLLEERHRQIRSGEAEPLDGEQVMQRLLDELNKPE